MGRTKLTAKVDEKGTRRCGWEDCGTVLSRYNDHVVCAAHNYEYALAYLPTAEPRK